MAVRVM